MIEIDYNIKPADLENQLKRFWDLSAKKIEFIEKDYDESQGSPVFTIGGKYTSKGWTEWTHGFQYGSAILQFDATGDELFLNIGRENTRKKMAVHVSHVGVHDHGFNNISTYGNLLRLIKENKLSLNTWEKDLYELAIKVSGAVQANRWTSITDGGFMYSFNGPHSLFVDTIRTCRILFASHALGHVLMGENDKKINLLHRAIEHMLTTAKYSVFYGKGRDIYDIRGRTAHECIFNVNNGQYRCPNSQQGYTGFSTWTRGLSWAISGFTEELEVLPYLDHDELTSYGGIQELEKVFLKAARATCDFFIDNSPSDGIPYWDTGAPGLEKMKNPLSKPADPFNPFEPVDSSAAAIAAQGFLRLGHYHNKKGFSHEASKYFQAGLTIARTLLSEPYLSFNPHHQGLMLHSIYHRPNNWDYIPNGQQVPLGESSMWGDYHIRELALYLHRFIKKDDYYSYFNCINPVQ